MERFLFLAANLTVTISFFVWATTKPTPAYRGKVLRQITLIFVFLILAYSAGWAMDAYILNDPLDEKFLPIVSLIVSFIGIGAIGVFASASFEYADNLEPYGLKLPGYCGLATACLQLTVCITQPPSLHKELLVLITGATFVFAIAILTAHQSQQARSS